MSSPRFCLGKQCTTNGTSQMADFAKKVLMAQHSDALRVPGTCLSYALARQRRQCHVHAEKSGGSSAQAHGPRWAERHCPRCADLALLDRTARRPLPRLHLSSALISMKKLDDGFKQVLVRRGRLSCIGEASVPRLPCSNSRGADHVAIRSFFSDVHGNALSPRGGGGGAFLEMGAYDGYHASNTWYFERCLGWRGILIEPDPLQFRSLVVNRPHTLNLHLAACSQHGVVSLVGEQSKTKVLPLPNLSVLNGSKWQYKDRLVTCGPLGDYLRWLGVRRLDFWSLDVEGAEEVAINSIDFRQLSLGVVLVEARRAKRRSEVGRFGRVRAALFRLGMAFAGQLVHTMPGRANVSITRAANATTLAQYGVVDEVWVNRSHLRRFFPESAALHELSSGRGVSTSAA